MNNEGRDPEVVLLSLCIHELFNSPLLEDGGRIQTQVYLSLDLIVDH